MNKLLRANFTRLKKSKGFWIGMAAMILYSLAFCLNEYLNKIQYGYNTSMDAAFFSPYIAVGILIAIFCSLFIGTEYSDGTIRNKLVVGHSRSSIYLANFVVCAVAGLLMNLAYLIATCALGIPLLGLLQTDFQIVLLLLLSGMLLTVACAAIFSLLSMLNHNKALVAVLCTVLAFAAILCAYLLDSKINAPEFLPSTSVTINSGGQAVVQPGELVPNPSYLNNDERALYQAVMDFLPTGQAWQIAARNAPHLDLMFVYSGIIIVAANVFGILLFRRKDLK